MGPNAVETWNSVKSKFTLEKGLFRAFFEGKKVNQGEYDISHINLRGIPTQRQTTNLI